MVDRTNLFDLTGHTALVTGGGYGLGRGLVHGLAAHGATVIGLARSEAALRETFSTLGSPHRYIVGDLTKLDSQQQGVLNQYTFNALTCVAALGFGDIPPAVFAAAFNRIENGGLIAFTIKTDFLDENDRSGFSVLIRRLIAEKALSLAERERYTHRVTADGQALEYEAFIGVKQADIRPEWVVEA